MKLVHDAGNIGARIKEQRVSYSGKNGAEDPHVFIPQQFENPNNTSTHLKYGTGNSEAPWMGRLTVSVPALAQEEH